MTLITKPDFTYVWASGGAVVAPNDTKKQQGWVAEAPPFQYDNWLQNRQDQMLAHINQRGIPAWDGLTNYEAGGLSYVQGSDGKVYKSVAASGPASVVSNPTTDGTDTYWTVAFADVGAFLTQAAGDTRYTQRANNLSDLLSAATAFDNIKQPASDTVSGVVELATSAEVLAGTDPAKATTPAALVAGLLGTSVRSTNGYATLPVKVAGVRQDIIVQWGYCGQGSPGFKGVTFPITFPNAVLGVVVQITGNLIAPDVVARVSSQSLTTAGFGRYITYIQATGAVLSGDDNSFFIAIGY